MEMMPIAGGSLALVGLVMMVIAGVMLMRGNKRQVRVVIPTSTAGKMPPPQARPAPPPPSPAPKPEPPKVEQPKVEQPKMEPPPPPPAPPPTVPEQKADPRVSEEGTRIAMIPAPIPVAPPPPPAPPEEATVAQPLPTAPVPHEPAGEAPQATIAITPGDMEDFRTIVEQAAPKSFGVLVGISGGVEGRELRIDEEGFVIGRDQRTAQLVISDPRISKRHVWVGVRNDAVWAVDVGSTNGTYLNAPRSERITEAKLEDGDVLILSEDAARFQYRK
jgi:hypothetical protein